MGLSASQPLRPDALGLSRRASDRVANGLGVRFGLSARLFVLTVAFVALAEIVICVPSVTSYRWTWLSDRIAAARVAPLVLDAAPDGLVSEDLARRLLAGIGARAVAVKSGDRRTLLSPDAVPETVSEVVDLREHSWMESIHGAWRTLISRADEPIRVIGLGQSGADLVEILIDEAPLRTAMTDFLLRLLAVSLAIAAAAAGFVFLLLQRVIVGPLRRLARNIADFASDPECPDRVIAPSRRNDEIGHAESALAQMEIALSGELRQKRRLAELGLSVSKINHELRNLLTTAQLLGDRLEGVADPLVQRIAPRLVCTLDRAIRFCEATLAYGRAAEHHPQRRMVRLASILTDLPDLAGLTASRVGVLAHAPADLTVDADPEQLSRALANLVRNAVQALDTAGARIGPPAVRVSASRDGLGGEGRVTILVSDNGPGLPPQARAHLFAPFQGSVRSGGTGLGLAIASELIVLNGGTLSLDPSAAGTTFRIVIPDRHARP